MSEVESGILLKEKKEENNEVLLKESKFILELNQNLEKLKNIVEKMPLEKGQKFSNWIKTKADYLGKEVDFKPNSLRAYSRGEIVCVNLGFNVGSEYGGEHFGVVIRDSNKANPGLNIIPLTSYKDERIAEEGKDLEALTDEYIEQVIHSNAVYLGNLKDINEKLSVALTDQLQYISKIRIKSPKSAKQKVVKLDSHLLDKLDEKIRKLYTKLK